MIRELFRSLHNTAAPASRVVEVGWAIQADKAGVIWGDPAPFSRQGPRPKSVKSVSFCPAAIDFDARHTLVACPIDVHLRFQFDDKGQPSLINVPGEQSTIRAKHLNQMVVIVKRSEWRDPNRPIIQIMTPYLFLADETVYINQVPPYMHYIDPPWPGTLIGGRFPIDVWPRHLMWAFEWHDLKKDLILKRGQPWFYAHFEPTDPSRPIRLVETRITPEVQAYMNSVSGVTNYVNRTFSLFERARSRRPKQLLFPVRTGSAD